jgi:flagellar transcriptional activator FlhD
VLVGVFPTGSVAISDTRISTPLIQENLRKKNNSLHGDSYRTPPMTKEPNMTNEQMLAEIKEANLTYLMLAQNLIRQDKAEALFRLGMSEEAADLIGALSPAQILKIASGNMLLCRFRVDDDIVWNLLTNHNVNRVDNDATTKLHASILMAGKFAETM